MRSTALSSSTKLLIRAATQEFGRTDAAQRFTFTRLNTEVLNCCKVYNIPPLPYPGSYPHPAGSTPVQAPADILRAGIFTHWGPYLFHSFTFIGITRFLVVLFGFCLVFLVGRFVVCVVFLFDWLSPFFGLWDAQVRRHFQDCHHRHDERSNGAKKNVKLDLILNRMRVGTQYIPEYREETSSKWFLLGDKLAKVPFELVQSTKQTKPQIPHNKVLRWQVKKVKPTRSATQLSVFLLSEIPRSRKSSQ